MSGDPIAHAPEGAGNAETRPSAPLPVADYADPKITQQRMHSTFDRRLLVFLWRHLTLINIAIIFVLVYAGFWALSGVRLSNPHIRGRMQFAAEFLALKGSDPVAVSRDVTVTLTRLKQDWPAFGFHFADYKPPHPTTVPATPVSELAFDDAASKLALTRDGSYEFQEALDNFNAFAATWYDTRDPVLSIRPDLIHDDQLRGGSAISLPQGSTAELRHDAEDFLQNYRMFDGRLAAATEQAKLRPWILFRFYDPKRYFLSQTLPFAFGTLLLACSLLLQFRFIDLSRSKRSDPNKPPLPKCASNPRWPKVWSQGCECPIEIPDSQIACAADKNLDALVPTRRLKLWIGLATAAAVFVELILDVPGVRMEWWVNVPLISSTAVTIVIIWSTLAEMGNWRLDRRGIGRVTRECRSRVLRPFLLGGAALLAATAWMLSYSLLILPLGRAEIAREIAQIVICLVTLVLLVRLGYRFYTELLDTDTPWKITDIEEEALNAEKVGLLDCALPHVDENMMKALILAIIPFASVFESLFG